MASVMFKFHRFTGWLLIWKWSISTQIQEYYTAHYRVLKET